jgi:predicted amidohydrolase YtcJ
MPAKSRVTEQLACKGGEGNVRYGSKADLTAFNRDVRFVPEADMRDWESSGPGSETKIAGVL